MAKEALTPRQKTAKLRERLHQVLPLLPQKWINLFMYLHPQYNDKMAFLNSVGIGTSLDEEVISKMEEIAKQLQTLKEK